MRMAASPGSGTPFCLLLNGELWTTTRAPAARWPRSDPLGTSGSACGSLKAPVHSTTRDTPWSRQGMSPVSYTHLRAHETRHDLVCRLLLEKKKKTQKKENKPQ